MRESSSIPYCGSAPAPGEWLARWNLDPLLLVMLALTSLAWFVWHRHRTGSADGRAAVAALAVATFLFVSPFCAMGSALFMVRILHDTILVLLLAPLIMAAFALQRRNIPGPLTMWTAIHVVVFWLWHAPPLYSAAMSSSAAFWTMQITIAGSAAVWWARLLRAPATGAAASLLATMVAMGVLGALITFAGRALYAPHWVTTQQWGLSPLEDQQIAGIIMWAPVSAAYLFAALVLLFRSLPEERLFRASA